MGLFDRKKKAPEPPPGPPIFTSRPISRQLNKQTPQQQQGQRPQISAPILEDPPYAHEGGGGEYGQRRSVVHDERGGPPWDQHQRPQARDSYHDTPRDSTQSDRDWTMVSPSQAAQPPSTRSQGQNASAPHVPGSSPPHGHSQAYYDVAPGSIFPSHQLAQSGLPPMPAAHARYPTAGSNHSHSGSREDLTARSSAHGHHHQPSSHTQQLPRRHEGSVGPGSYDGSHESHMGGRRAEVTTPVSLRDGEGRYRANSDSSRVGLGSESDRRERQGSGDSMPARPPRGQPPLGSPGMYQQSPSSHSQSAVVSVTPSSPPPPPPPPPPQLGQHAKVPSFSSSNNHHAEPAPILAQVYDAPSYPAQPTARVYQPSPNAEHHRYSGAPPPPPPPLAHGTTPQHGLHRSHDWTGSNPSAQQQQQPPSRLSHQPQPVSITNQQRQTSYTSYNGEMVPSSAPPHPTSNVYASPPQIYDPEPPQGRQPPPNGRYSQQPRQMEQSQQPASLPATPMEPPDWRSSAEQPPLGGATAKKDKGEKKKFGLFSRDDESTRSAKKMQKKHDKEYAKDRDRESAQSDMSHGTGTLPSGWKEEDVEETITSLSRLPPHPAQSSSEHLAFTSQIDDLTHRLANDPTNGTLAEKTARQLRKEMRDLPDEVKKDSRGGQGAPGSVAELWWKLMWTGDAKIMRLCSNQKFLSNLESAFKKLPANSQQKIDLYHVFGVITETFRGSNGSEDLEKYFSKVYENASESGLNRTTPPQYLQALSSGPDRERGSRDNSARSGDRDDGRPRQTASGFQANFPSASDDIERLARECEGAWKTKEDLLVLLRDARSDGIDEPELRTKIRESYQACFHIETELVNHRPWAESQAAESLLTAAQPRAAAIAAPLQPGSGPKMEPESPGLGLFQPELRETRAQVVLNRLIEVTGEVSEALESFHEWERELQEDEELRIISERSRKETRHDRSQPIQMTDHLSVQPQNSASASRSPSPIRTPLWDDSTNNTASSSPLPSIPSLPNISHNSIPVPPLSESGVPDLPPPRGPNDPALVRSSSPQSRPLPIPDVSNGKAKGKGFMGMLGSGGGRGAGVPASNGSGTAVAQDGRGDPPPGMSEKAMGKRRVEWAYEVDDAFDPDDIYKTNDPVRPSSPSSNHSSSDELADDWVPPKPVTYVYDAALERKVFLEEERKREAIRALKAKGRGSSYVADEDDNDAVTPTAVAPGLETVSEQPSQPPAPPPAPASVPQGGRLEKEKEMGRMLSGLGSAPVMDKEHSNGGGATGVGRKLSFWRKSGRGSDTKE